LNINLPNWFIELYTTVPIIGAEFGVQENESDEAYDGISYIIWRDVNDIIEESTEYEPGMIALNEGYVFVASCSHGSGDPIFLNLNLEEPRLFRIYHDDFTKAQLKENLVSLFKSAVI
jgi:hypothetical protein